MKTLMKKKKQKINSGVWTIWSTEIDDKGTDTCKQIREAQLPMSSNI